MDPLYKVTALVATLGFGVAVYFMAGTLSPTANVVADRSDNNVRQISLEGLAPGEFLMLKQDGRPIAIWRRNPAQIGTALR